MHYIYVMQNDHSQGNVKFPDNFLTLQGTSTYASSPTSCIYHHQCWQYTKSVRHDLQKCSQ